jgi:methyl-accepting chemotaxis protein
VVPTAGITGVNTAAELIAEISTASAEQASGVTDVGKAVCQMDQAIQQNATHTEELAGTSRTLATQAQRLAHQISQFTLTPQAFDFSIAKMNHPVSGKECAFGKWLYGGGIQAYQHLPEMQELERIHLECHDSIRKVIELKQSGNDAGATQELARMERISGRIVDLLGALEGRAAQATAGRSRAASATAPAPVGERAAQPAAATSDAMLSRTSVAPSGDFEEF